MPNPAWVTSENIKFNSTLNNAAVLKTAGNIRTVVLWDNLTSGDQAILENFINLHGGTLPLAGPTSGVQTVSFGKTVIGATVTGISNVAVATAASTTVNIGGAAVGGDASGLSSVVGTKGYQVVNYSAPIVGANSTGLVPTAGRQDITFSALSAGGDATNLVGGTTYTTTITVDGVAKPISILGSNADTFTKLVNEINTDLGASATAAIVGQDIRITSATFGSTSKVKITPGTLFPAIATYVGTIPAVDGVNTNRSYSATVTVDGVLKSVKFTGVAGDTVQHVIDEINTDLGAAATAALTGGNIVITSATTGLGSSVRIDDHGFLFNSMTGYVGITNSRSVAPTIYTATITVDGVDKAIAIQGNTAQTFTTLANEINTDLGASAVASIANNKLVITSASTGTSSTVSIRDGNLLKSLGFVGLSAPVNGISDMVAAMKKVPVGSSSLYDYLGAFTVGAKPVKPTVPATLPKTPEFTYWVGGAWKYLHDDSNV